MGADPVDTSPVDTSRGDERANEFAVVLQHLREARKLSQSELAKRMGRDPSTISLLESKRRHPTRRLIDEIASALGLTEADRLRLLHMAGFTGDELGAAIQRVVALLARQTTLDPTESALVQAGFTTAVASWRELFDGLTELRGGKLSEAATRFHNMADHAEYDPTLRVSALIRSADALLECGRLGDATKCLARADQLIGQWPPDWAPSVRAEHEASQAMLDLREGRDAKARERMARSANWYTTMLNIPSLTSAAEWGLGKSYKRLAQVALFQDQPGEALRFCRLAAEFLGRPPDSPIRATWLRRTKDLEGWALSKGDHFAKARATHREAWRESRAAGDAYGMAKGALYIGDDIRRALLRRVNNALRPAMLDGAVEPGERRRIVADTLRNAPEADGHIRALLDEARQSYDNAISDGNVLGRQILLGRALLGLGVIQRLQATVSGSPAGYAYARISLERALKQERGIKQNRRLPSIFIALAELAWEEGEYGWLERAHHAYQEALRQLETLGSGSRDPASRRQHDAVREALQVLSQLAPEPPTSPSALETWGDAIDSRGSPVWRMLCAEVVQAIYQAIRDEGLEPYASSDHALEWDLFLASIEVLPAPHLLAQNGLSASLSPRAESVHLGDRRAEAAASARHAALLDAVRAGAQSRDFGICRDLCSRSAVELALNTGDARADAQAVDQVCEAARLLREDPKGYGLIAAKDDLPLGFEIKQSHVLVEVPRDLAQRFPHGDVDLARLHPDEKVCYHIRSEALASQLTTLFDQLAAHAGEQMASDDATAEWMSRLARKYEAQASARGPRL